MLTGEITRDMQPLASRMNGKICLVTGATSGIGFFTAQEIARLGATVLVIGRNQQKCIDVITRIKRESGNPAVEYYLADLSSQAEIRGITAEFYRQYDHLDVLVNNAGGVFLTRKHSAEGIEMTFALNHLAYFLLTNLLLDALKAAHSARVINVASGSHLHEHVDFDDFGLSGFHNPVHAYGQSKLANILFTYELARRLANTRITSNALTPGMVATDIWKKYSPVLAPILFTFIRIIGKTPLEGAQTSIYLATSPEVEGITGKYFVDCQPVKSDPITYDIPTAQRLWEKSAQLVGL